MRVEGFQVFIIIIVFFSFYQKFFELPASLKGSRLAVPFQGIY